MFFFFDDDFRPGTVCRVSSGHQVNKLVVVHKVHRYDGRTTLWCYENRPVKFRLDRYGRQVIDFDPACVTSPFYLDELEITNELPLQTDGWGASYRRQAMQLGKGNLNGK